MKLTGLKTAHWPLPPTFLEYFPELNYFYLLILIFSFLFNKLAVGYYIVCVSAETQDFSGINSPVIGKEMLFL